MNKREIAHMLILLAIMVPPAFTATMIMNEALKVGYSAEFRTIIALCISFGIGIPTTYYFYAPLKTLLKIKQA